MQILFGGAVYIEWRGLGPLGYPFGMVAVVNFALAALGIGLWFFFDGLELPALEWAAVGVVVLIVVVHILYRLISGRWLDGTVRLSPSKDPHTH